MGRIRRAFPLEYLLCRQGPCDVLTAAAPVDDERLALERVLHTFAGLLQVGFCLVGLTFGDELVVVGGFASGLLGFAFEILTGVLDFIFRTHRASLSFFFTEVRCQKLALGDGAGDETTDCGHGRNNQHRADRILFDCVRRFGDDRVCGISRRGYHSRRVLSSIIDGISNFVSHGSERVCCRIRGRGGQVANGFGAAVDGVADLVIIAFGGYFRRPIFIVCLLGCLAACLRAFQNFG